MTQAQSTSLMFVNGQLVQADELRANYDGKHLAIEMNENGRHFSKILNNTDIERILTQPANKLALEDRLHRDFLGKKGNKSHKSQKTRKGKKKSQKGRKSKKNRK